MKLSKELKRKLRSTWEIKSEQKPYQAQKTCFSTKKSLYFIYYSLKCSKYIYIYRELFFVVYFVQGTSHRRQLIQSIGNLWAFYLSVSVPYILLYIVTQSGRASLLNVSRCVSTKSRGTLVNISRTTIEAKTRTQTVSSVQSSGQNSLGEGKEGRQVKDVAGVR